MNYTPFGEFFRMLRIKHREILNDASALLHVSSAQKELADAVERSKTSIKINLSTATYPQRAAAIQFQRSFDDMDDDTANEIIKIIERNRKSGL